MEFSDSHVNNIIKVAIGAILLFAGILIWKFAFSGFISIQPAFNGIVFTFSILYFLAGGALLFLGALTLYRIFANH
ncbi:MAG: hypothetical protein M1402_01615 [Candidatus Thermoplasmatota archaeon]|nr:hypothetical protein [Candidatus Thermoplasmatota archaeon]MCL5665363.1 hypothetical protein [Candidatus Thermoplasmatota archaeon]